MLDQFSRTELLLGRAGMERLAKARVAVFGLGGVGGYTVEALARSGVGTLDLIDSDRVSLTNLNRQILATHRTLGQFKADAARERVLEIHPEAVVNVWKVFYGPGTVGTFDFSRYDYVVDAIDTVTGKLTLIQEALAAGAPVISCMGAGNKLDPTAFRVADIYETSVCPLARVMRKELKKKGRPPSEGGLLPGTAHGPGGQFISGVPGGRGAAAGAGKQRLRAHRRGADSGGRGSQGPGPGAGIGIFPDEVPFSGPARQAPAFFRQNAPFSPAPHRRAAAPPPHR